MRWLGNAGWHIQAGASEVLVDPFVSRFDTGLGAGAFNPSTPLRVDRDAVDRSVGSPDIVLVTHSHWDHFADVPYIAATHRARVMGTLTTHRLCEAMDVPSSQLLAVKGGERLQLDDLLIQVVPSLHSRTGSGGLLFPGHRVDVPRRPATIADLPEGDTLAYVVSRPGGPTVYLSGASDLDDQVLDGVQPDVAAVAVASNDVTHEYIPRLMEALSRPDVVIPVHWDDFESPATSPPPVTKAAKARLEQAVRDIRKASPRSKVIVPDYETILNLL